MKQYHKIQTVFLRDPDDNMKTLLEGIWSKPEFEYLKNNRWVCTEKIDGTNIRVMWDGTTLTFGGKTDGAQTPSFLLNKLSETFSEQMMKECFGSDPIQVCLYGEGYGRKIQKGGGNYIADGNNFILFDIWVDGWWLERSSIEQIGDKMNIDTVPILATCTLKEAIEMVRAGFTSTISENKEYLAEGLIAKPEVELFNRKGERVITKIKHRDFKQD